MYNVNLYKYDGQIIKGVISFKADAGQSRERSIEIYGKGSTALNRVEIKEYEINRSSFGPVNTSTARDYANLLSHACYVAECLSNKCFFDEWNVIE